MTSTFILLFLPRQIKGYNSSELEGWRSLFESTKGLEWGSCNSETVYDDPCTNCGRIGCELSQGQYTINEITMNGLQMTGTIPPAISRLEMLKRFVLHDNHLSGTIPIELSTLKVLKRVTLDRNELSGTIPKELANLPKLEILYLFSNQFTGTFPPELSQLVNLKELHFGYNELNGTIPEEIGNFPELVLLRLDSNRLTGTIPRNISQLKKLRQLYLRSNSLHGTIPTEISQLKQLQRIYINSNKFSGSIPPEVSQLTMMQRLVMHENRINGSIPPEIGQLTGMREFTLSSNFLSGTIPREIAQLQSLQIMWLHSNELSGTIPPEIAQLTNLQRLLLHSNKLTGSIPPEISQLTRLQELQLSFNQLNGTIPHQISLLTNLRVLYLHSNQLSGSIPSTIAQITNLQELFISSNRLSGVLPVSLGHLNNLRSFDASHNNITGSFPFEWVDKHGGYWGPNAKNNMVSPFFKQLKQFRVCCNRLSGHLRDFINPFLTVNNLAQLDLSHNTIFGSFDYWSQRWFEFFAPTVWASGLQSLILLDLSFNQIQDQLPNDLPDTLPLFFITDNFLEGSIPASYSQLFIFLSKNNRLRDSSLPMQFNHTENWMDLHEHDGTGIECQQLATVDGSTKTFDIQPIYDHFNRCRCKPGYFNFQTDSSFSNPFAKCDPTPPGYFTSTSNRLRHPTPCPVGHFSSQSASTQCETCTFNTFSFEAQSKCYPCIEKTQCADGVISLKLNSWMAPRKELNLATKDSDIYSCLNKDACIVNGTKMRCAWESGYDNSSVLCSECLDGFYSSERLTKLCSECTVNVTRLTIIVGVMVLILAIIIIVYQLITMYKAEILATVSRAKRQHHVTINRECLLRILVDHMQILLIMSDLQMRGPQLFHTLISSSMATVLPTLSPAALKCTLNVGFDTSVVIAALIPLILLAFLFTLVLLIGFLLQRSIIIIFHSAFTVFVFLFYLIHPLLMKQLLQVFQFHHQDIEGEYYLQSDMLIAKSSSEYTTVFVIALVGVIVYGVISPLLAVLSLREKANAKDALGRTKLQDAVFEQKYGFLYLGYRAIGGLYLWELVIYFRKSVLLILAVFLGSNSFLQSYLASLVLIIALIVQNRFQPYRSDYLNKVEIQSLTILVVTQMCMLLSSHYGLDATSIRDIVISFLLITINAYFVVYAIRRILDGTNLAIFANITKCCGKNKEKIYPDTRHAEKRMWGFVASQGRKMVAQLEKMSEQGVRDGDGDLKEIISLSMDYLDQLYNVCNSKVKVENQEKNSKKAENNGEIEENEEDEEDEEKKDSIRQPQYTLANSHKTDLNSHFMPSEGEKVLHKQVGFIGSEKKCEEKLVNIDDFCLDIACFGRQFHRIWHQLQEIATKGDEKPEKKWSGRQNPAKSNKIQQNRAKPNKTQDCVDFYVIK